MFRSSGSFSESNKFVLCICLYYAEICWLLIRFDVVVDLDNWKGVMLFTSLLALILSHIALARYTEALDDQNSAYQRLVSDIRAQEKQRSISLRRLHEEGEI